MTSKTLKSFWKHYHRLPPDIQSLAREKFALWKRKPFHASLHFKELYADLWSVRINLQFRALARRRDDEIIWFWIGPHSEYDRLIKT